MVLAFPEVSGVKPRLSLEASPESQWRRRRSLCRLAQQPVPVGPGRMDQRQQPVPVGPRRVVNVPSGEAKCRLVLLPVPVSQRRVVNVRRVQQPKLSLLCHRFSDGCVSLTRMVLPTMHCQNAHNIYIIYMLLVIIRCGVGLVFR